VKRIFNVAVPLILFIGFGVAGLGVSQALFPEDHGFYPLQPLPPFDCVSYDPSYRLDVIDPEASPPSIPPEWIESDLQFLSPYTHCVRIYTTLNGMDAVPSIAARHHMSVIAGSYIFKDPAKTKRDMDGLIAMSKEHSNVTQLIVGNETIFFYKDQDKPEEQVINELIYWIDYVKARVKLPVSTAESADIWHRNRKVAAHVDGITVHIFPFWDSITADEAPATIFRTLQILQDAYPGKKIFLGETGWPSMGLPEHRAIPDTWVEYRFWKSFLPQAYSHGLSFVAVEAFDQPWKLYSSEGRVGPHWGLFDKHKKSKFSPPPFLPIGDMNLTISDCASLAVAFVFFLLWSDFTRPLRLKAWVVSAFLAQVLGFFYVSQAKSLMDENMENHVVALCFLIPGYLIILICLLYKTRTVLQLIGEKPLKRQFETFSGVHSEAFVSVHVPCRNEPPGQVIACIQSLLRQTHRHVEIIVVDNNTADEHLWRPVEAFCANHANVKFFHVENMRGFKAGALTFALNHSSPAAQIIGVVDADYVVSEQWLSECLRHFDGNVGAVQAPQDYEPIFGSLPIRAMYDEYSGFFQIGMVQRNECNAIIQHGTMLLLQREALLHVGGWHTDAIVEDTDLGLRLLIGGYECRYVNKVYGKGLLPNRFSEYRQQRFRWAYGATRTLIKYSGHLFLFKRGLSLTQRVHFILGWTQWIGNIFHPFFVLTAIVLSLFYIHNHRYIHSAALFSPILLYVLLDSVYSFILYAKRLHLSVDRILYSFIAGGSLVWTIAHAVATGLCCKQYPFKVTRKGKAESGIRWRESVLPFGFSAALLLLAAHFLYDAGLSFNISPDLQLWIALLVVLAFPGIANVIMTLGEKKSSDIREWVPLKNVSDFPLP